MIICQKRRKSKSSRISIHICSNETNDETVSSLIESTVPIFLIISKWKGLAVLTHLDSLCEGTVNVIRLVLYEVQSLCDLHKSLYWPNGEDDELISTKPTAFMCHNHRCLTLMWWVHWEIWKTSELHEIMVSLHERSQSKRVRAELLNLRTCTYRYFNHRLFPRQRLG